MVVNDALVIRAKTSVLRVSYRKLELVASLVRGYDVTKAMMQLDFCKKKASFYVSKVLKSALANAQYNCNLDVDELYISKILIGKSITLKRICPKAMGRASRINKRYSNIVIELRKRV